MRSCSLLMLCVLAGCGGNNSTLSGTVSYRGKPVTSGMVVVLNPDNTAAKGEIEADGSYEVSGVGQGDIKVGVLSPDPTGRVVAPKGSRRRKPASNSDWVRLPDHVGNPGTSGITFTMTGSASHDIVVP